MYKVKNWMQQPEMKEATRLAKFSGEIPTSKTMVPVRSLLTTADKQRVAEYNFGPLVVKISSKTFFVSQLQSVPAEAQLQRDSQQNLLGVPAVTGG